MNRLALAAALAAGLWCLQGCGGPAPPPSNDTPKGEAAKEGTPPKKGRLPQGK